MQRKEQSTSKVKTKAKQKQSKSKAQAKAKSKTKTKTKTETNKRERERERYLSRDTCHTKALCTNSNYFARAVKPHEFKNSPRGLIFILKEKIFFCLPGLQQF